MVINFSVALSKGTYNGFIHAIAFNELFAAFGPKGKFLEIQDSNSHFRLWRGANVTILTLYRSWIKMSISRWKMLLIEIERFGLASTGSKIIGALRETVWCYFDNLEKLVSEETRSRNRFNFALFGPKSAVNPTAIIQNDVVTVFGSSLSTFIFGIKAHFSRCPGCVVHESLVVAHQLLKVLENRPFVLGFTISSRSVAAQRMAHSYLEQGFFVL